MKFISIIGEYEHFDEFFNEFIADSNLHPENALNVITQVKGIHHMGIDPKDELLLKKCVKILEQMKIDSTKINSDESNRITKVFNTDEMENYLDSIGNEYRNVREKYDAAVERINEYYAMKSSIESIINLNVDVEEFFSLEFIKFRFGRMPSDSFKILEKWAEEMDFVIVPLNSDAKIRNLIYFTPSAICEKVDGIASSAGFERIRLSEELSGKPQDAYKQITDGITELEEKIKSLESEVDEFVKKKTAVILQIYSFLLRIIRNHEGIRNALYTSKSFYICGWLPDDEVKELATRIEKDGRGTLIVEDPDQVKNITPPTELTNNRIFGFFETLVKMYALPVYNEIDPTAFVAVTYFLMFGIMFGDIGQGAVILLGGLILMKRGVGLAGVFVCAGASSIVFGFVYGSVFGYENIIPGVIYPMENQFTLLIGGVVIGVMFMTVGIVMNILNGLKEKNLGRMLFDRNGVVGLVFYWALIVFSAYYVISGRALAPVFVMMILIGAPFLAMFFREPIERLMEKKRFLPDKKGMFFVEAAFDMIDMLLSVVSNTVSFIRIGAFALNHVGLFVAFHILSDMAGNMGGIIVNIIANVLIIALEGLIVWIQCLRLEYYELFGKFYKGGGKEYKPLSRGS
ncbi:MAG: hypothetical protein FWH55_03350 [Oscillospiraceae bacterium]|nr:hypothetical protein [Oscillospiraceae bacterium]